MNKKKIIGICVVIFVIVFIAVCIAIVQFSKKDLEEAKKGLEETQEEYGWVENGGSLFSSCSRKIYWR